jgi:hypothetical protein
MVYDAAHKVHVLFGSQFTADPHTWMYDLRKNEWHDAKPSRTPPIDQNDAVMTYDPLHCIVLCIVKISEGKDEDARHRLETWEYDTGLNQWTKLNPQPEPEPSGNRARQLVFAPELNLAILENCTSRPREQQVWTYRYTDRSADVPSIPAVVKAHSPPRLVEEAVVSVRSSARIEIAWKAPNDKTTIGYHVERAPVEVLTEDQLKRLKQSTPALTEPSVGAIRRIGPFRRLTEQPVPRTQFIDTTVDLSQPHAIQGDAIYERQFNAEQLDSMGKAYRFAVFAYRIRSVNAAGTESGPSPAVFTIPASPQWLFSREEGMTCHLKWAANVESGLRGYRVYRMDGRWDKDPVSRLTADPIAATAFADQQAGQATRRYYVVAVDAVGQEGFPSSPVWFSREWRQWYVPFVGDWHQ